MPTTLPDTAAGSRILVVEDEAIIAEEIRDRLLRLHFNVIGIEDSGRRAIEAVDRANPDLVLMDIHLKGDMDGIETAAAILKRTDVPVVYLTAHSDPATVQRAKETAPLGYILKPIHERELEVTIEMAIYRHGLERRLRESELRYAATLKSIGDAVMATDPSGRITFMNPVAESLTGWDAQDARSHLADEILVLFDDAGRQRLESPIARAMLTRTTVRLSEPTVLMPRDGSAIPIDDSASPILDSHGNVLGAVVAFHDIRERRRAEEAIMKAEGELRKAQKLESIGQLAGGVAHDFNNFLTAINGYCDMLLHTEALPAEGAILVQQMIKACERSAQLSAQLLAFSRQQILSPKVIDLNALIPQTEKLLHHLLGANIKIEIDLAADLASVRVDPAQVEQIVINLAVNGRDAMPDGGRLTIQTANITVGTAPPEMNRLMPPGRYVRLSVSDTGVGMNAATRARLFEPFFTTKAKGKGTGLGLATVYGIVTQSEAYIRVHTEPGKGSLFEVYFPAVEEKPSEPVPETAEAKSAARGHETVLLVEDDDAVRRVTAKALRALGYQVIPARNGEEAIELHQNHGISIDVLVTDTVMPTISGPQVAQQLVQGRPDLPILFVSGYVDRSLDQALKAFPAAQFLQKPFTAVTLAQNIRELLAPKGRG